MRNNRIKVFPRNFEVLNIRFLNIYKYLINFNKCLNLYFNLQESSDIMRSLVTGLVMLVDLLKSHDTRVLAAACAVIGILAQEPGNLAILTDYDIVQRLSSLVQTVTLYLQNFLLRINNSPTDSNYFINNYQKLTYII